MNFYKELAREMKNAGLESEIIEVPKELRPTPKDIAELDRKCEIRCEENRKMMILSELYASEGMPAGESYALKDCRTCTNPSCRIETYEKPVSDCFGWENKSLRKCMK